MNDLPKLYFTMERYLFPLLEEELGVSAQRFGSARFRKSVETWV